MYWPIRARNCCVYLEWNCLSSVSRPSTSGGQSIGSVDFLQVIPIKSQHMVNNMRLGFFFLFTKSCCHMSFLQVWKLMFLSLAIKVEIDFSCSYEHFSISETRVSWVTGLVISGLLTRECNSFMPGYYEGTWQNSERVNNNPTEEFFQTPRRRATSVDDSVNKILLFGI